MAQIRASAFPRELCRSNQHLPPTANVLSFICMKSAPQIASSTRMAYRHRYEGSANLLHGILGVGGVAWGVLHQSSLGFQGDPMKFQSVSPPTRTRGQHQRRHGNSARSKTSLRGFGSDTGLYLSPTAPALHPPGLHPPALKSPISVQFYPVSKDVSKATVLKVPRKSQHSNPQQPAAAERLISRALINLPTHQQVNAFTLPRRHKPPRCRALNSSALGFVSLSLARRLGDPKLRLDVILGRRGLVLAWQPDSKRVKKTSPRPALPTDESRVELVTQGAETTPGSTIELEIIEK